jgi:hypothetical protein
MIRQTVSQSKWDRAKAQLNKLRGRYETCELPLLHYKRLEEIRGFLCYISMTYEIVTHYLKGLHLTLAAHHPQRDAQGWKLSPKEWDAYVWGKESEGKFSSDEAKTFSAVGHDTPPPKAKFYQNSQPTTQDSPAKPPKLVHPVKRLRFDIDALCALFDEETPIEVLLRASRVYSVLYGFAGASGTGFSSTVLGKDGIKYRIGTWESDVDEDSLDFRELNLWCAR